MITRSSVLALVSPCDTVTSESYGSPMKVQFLKSAPISIFANVQTERRHGGDQNGHHGH